MEFFVSGFGLSDLALFLQRVVIGVFFVSYRFRWVYDPSLSKPWFSKFRREKLLDRLRTCGYRSSPVLAGTVAMGEILAGCALIVGLFSVPAAVGVFVILVFANCCTPKEEIPLMKPVDCIEAFNCYLRLMEPLYLLLALSIILVGPGKWSLDYALWTVLR